MVTHAGFHNQAISALVHVVICLTYTDIYAILNRIKRELGYLLINFRGVLFEKVCEILTIYRIKMFEMIRKFDSREVQRLFGGFKAQPRAFLVCFTF